MTGGPHLASKPHRRRRGGLVLAVLAALGVLAGQAPASGQAPLKPDAPRPCSALDSELRDSCANQPLDAYRRPVERKPEADSTPSADPLRVVPREGGLTRGRVGQTYSPAALVVGGVRPYTVRSYGLPPSMYVDELGFLTGRPAAGDAGDYPFGAVVRDRAGHEIRAYDRLRILGGVIRRDPTPVDGRGRRPLPPPPPPPPPPTPVRVVTAQPEGVMTVYVLRADNPLMAPPAKAAVAPAPVVGPSVPPQPQPPPPPPPPTALSTTRAASGSVTYRLPVQPAQAAEASAAPADFATIARPLVNVEYPSRILFEAAVMNLYKGDLRKILQAGPDPARARATAAATPGALSQQAPPVRPGISLEQLRAVSLRVAETRTFDKAPALNWAPEAGCGCAVPVGAQTKIVYGFFPFWRSETPPPSITFSQISRIGFLGVQMKSDGTWKTPTSAAAPTLATKPAAAKARAKPTDRLSPEEKWWTQTSTFARAAQAHGARLDLVLQRSDWSFLAGMHDEAEVDSLAADAARGAMALVDTRLTGRGAGDLLLPFWKEPKYVFDGVTVMFDWPVGVSAQEFANYIRFQDVFITKLIAAMQVNGRDYMLNVVAPDAIAVSQAPVETDNGMVERLSVFGRLLAYKQMAEPPEFHAAAPPADRELFVGRSHIRIHLMVPVLEPSSDNKKKLRETMDSLKDIRGYNRVAVLNSILPVIYLPAGDGERDPPDPPGKAPKPPKPTPVLRTSDEQRQLSDDIIYYRQNFGGVAFWPAPIQGVGMADEVYADVQRTCYQRDSSALARATSSVICSLVLRLLWQGLVLVTLAAGIAYLIWGQASGRAKLYGRGVLLLAAGLFVLSAVLLQVDPALDAISQGNMPLYVLLAVLLASAIWVSVKPKIPRP